MTNETNIVAFVVACVDQRHHVEEAMMIAQLKAVLAVDEVYLGTTAGPDGVLCAQGCRGEAMLEDATIIKNAKGATVFAVMGHYGCAGHAVADEQHDADTRVAAQVMADELGVPVWPLIFKPGSPGGATWICEKLADNAVSPSE